MEKLFTWGKCTVCLWTIPFKNKNGADTGENETFADLQQIYGVFFSRYTFLFLARFI